MYYLLQIIKLKDGETMSWRLMKVPLIMFWYKSIEDIFRLYNSAPLPAGICSILPCDFFENEFIRILTVVSSFLLMFIYVFEYRMKLTVFLIAVISLFTFSLEESNGIYNRTAILSAIFFAQYIAYLLKGKKYATPILFSRQIIAAAYSLAGIAKLSKSGITWPLDAPYLLLQIKKGAYYRYFDDSDFLFFDSKNKIIDFFIDNPYLLLLALFSVFMLELCSFIILINNKTAFCYGILLLLMHIGIWYTMDIVIYHVVYPMAIILINPLDLIYKFVITFRRLILKKYQYR